MDQVWSLDQNLFRMIHHGWNSPAVASFWQTASAMGLAHIHLLPLIVYAAKDRFSMSLRTTPIVVVVALVLVLINGNREGLLLQHGAAFLVCLVFFAPTRRHHFPAAFTAFAIAGVIHIAFKQLVDRMRPSMFADSVPLENVYLTNSFPSGHTCTSVAIAVALAWCWWHEGLHKWAISVLAWALLVGISRIAVGVHYPTDVLGGIFVGLASAAVGLIAFWKGPSAPSVQTSPSP